jgi:hypothetical protein
MYFYNHRDYHIATGSVPAATTKRSHRTEQLPKHPTFNSLKWHKEIIIYWPKKSRLSKSLVIYLLRKQNQNKDKIISHLLQENKRLLGKFAALPGTQKGPQFNLNQLKSIPFRPNSNFNPKIVKQNLFSV